MKRLQKSFGSKVARLQCSSWKGDRTYILQNTSQKGRERNKMLFKETQFLHFFSKTGRLEFGKITTNKKRWTSLNLVPGNFVSLVICSNILSKRSFLEGKKQSKVFDLSQSYFILFKSFLLIFKIFPQWPFDWSLLPVAVRRRLHGGWNCPLLTHNYETFKIWQFDP